MNGIAKFHKVSYEQYKRDFIEQMHTTNGQEISDEDVIIQQSYDTIQLPKRVTAGSAGYDFFAPYHFNIPFGRSLVIPTGIRCEFFDPAWFLNIMPRSGQGFRSGIHLSNTCGIIDSDYFHANNEGHIMIKLVNDSTVGQNRPFCLECGDAFAQGIIMPYGLTVDDDATEARTGGFGSTSRK